MIDAFNEAIQLAKEHNISTKSYKKAHRLLQKDHSYRVKLQEAIDEKNEETLNEALESIKQDKYFEISDQLQACIDKATKLLEEVKKKTHFF